MSKDERAAFTLSDVRAIRYLVLVLGGVGGAMLVFTDPDTPLMVVGFITIVTVVPLAAIYVWRRVTKKEEPPSATRTAAPPPPVADRPRQP